MDTVIVERCCGLDVHKDVVVACVLVSAAGGKARKQVRSFSTFTSSLLELAAWLMVEVVRQVVFYRL
jgi:hypothetical protein